VHEEVGGKPWQVVGGGQIQSQTVSAAELSRERMVAHKQRQSERGAEVVHVGGGTMVVGTGAEGEAVVGGETTGQDQR
jgi:hypothetical protein